MVVFVRALDIVAVIPLYLVYLPCLFLVQSGRVDLEQEELFGDLWVVLCGTQADNAPVPSV